MENTENQQTENAQEIVSLTVIEQALERENITKQIISKLKSDYSGLTINGIDDIDGFKKVDEARKECKVVRVTAAKICKLGREKAIQEQKDWIAKEKEVVSEIEEIEIKLENELKRIKEEKERILFEAAQREKLPIRKEKFLTIGIELQDEELLKLDDFNFDKLFNEFYVKHLEDIAAKAKIEAERVAKENEDRLAEEKRLADIKAEAERVEAKRIADEKAAALEKENERLKKEKDEADKKAAEVKAKADAELAEVNKKAKDEADRQSEIIRKQKEENDRLAKEAKDKADAELLAQKKAKDEADKLEAQRLADEKNAALAPDKDKLKNYVSTFVTVKVEFELTSDEAKSVKQNIDDKFSAFKNWALTEIEKIK